MASTIKDVARWAGVSTTTVSRVLNGAGNVSGETRTRVLAAISRLLYCPNPHASELRRAKDDAPSRGRTHVRALVGNRASPPSYSGADLQKADRQKGQLQFLEGEFMQVKRAIAKLDRDLEKLRSIIG
jgi:hypothetical protein